MSFDSIPDRAAIDRTIEAALARNIQASYVEDREQALEAVTRLIPAGSSVMTGSSTTLEQIGFIEKLISGQHPWKNLKEEIVNETDPSRQAELRRASAVCDYFLGSVHALVETGETITASASGSQLPAYAFTAGSVIWVAGAQKIVADRHTGFLRIKDYVFPLEDARMKSLGAPGSGINKVLIFARELDMNRKVHLLIVGEKLGF